MNKPKTCLVVNAAHNSVRHIESLSNAKSIYMDKALESGLLFFAETAEDLSDVSLDDLLQVWKATEVDWLKKIKAQATMEPYIDVDRDGDEETRKKLFNAWFVTYPVHDIWDGTPVVDGNMEVTHKNDREHKRSERAKLGAAKAAPKRKQVSTEGPWVLTKDAAEIFANEKFKQHRVVGAYLVSVYTDSEITRDHLVGAAKHLLDDGKFRVSKKTQELGDGMYDQLADWWIRPMVKGGMLEPTSKEG